MSRKEKGIEEKALTNLSLRIDLLKSRARGEEEQERVGGGLEGMGLGARVMVELVVAPCVGGGLGYSVDVLLGTLPLCLIGGVVLGGVAGVLNVKRLSDREDAKAMRREAEREAERENEGKREAG